MENMLFNESKFTELQHTVVNQTFLQLPLQGLNYVLNIFDGGLCFLWKSVNLTIMTSIPFSSLLLTILRKSHSDLEAKLC